MQKYCSFLMGILLIAVFPSLGFAMHIPPGGGGDPPPNPVEKYAFFFWSREVTCRDAIGSYQSKLSSLGYTTYQWKNTNPEEKIESFIDDLEDSNDKLFFYLAGHGSYYVYSDVLCDPFNSIASWKLKQLLEDYLEATDIAILVDACYAGEFVDQFSDNDGYLVMTSCSHTNTCEFFIITLFGIEQWRELEFSHMFFSATCWTDNAIATFTATAELHEEYDPQIVNNADYDFF